MEDYYFDKLMELALEEDLGPRGDVTSRAIFQESDVSRAYLVSKGQGVLAGMNYFQRVFERVNPETRVDFLKEDGASLKPGDRIAWVEGLTYSVLEAERTAINFLSFLSGIATETRIHVEASGHTGKAVVLDTRKTLPGYRTLSKEAVVIGGGKNHRMGLFDLVMIKDNHIDAAGSIQKAVDLVRSRWDREFSVEVECRTLDEVDQALKAGTDIIMLDNMSEEDTAEGVRRGRGRVIFEASGNMTPEKISRYSPLGVDYISVGGLTHSVRAFDFSLKMDEK